MQSSFVHWHICVLLVIGLSVGIPTGLAAAQSIDEILVFARTDFVYESRQWITAVNEAELGDTYLVNARTGFQTDSFTAAVYVENILDEDTPVLVSDFPNFSAPLQRLTTSFPMAPRRGRNYGFNVSYRFGQ